MSFINWFLRHSCGQFYADVDPKFIEEVSKEPEISALFDNIDETLKIVLTDDFKANNIDKELVRQAIKLYGIAHSKYLTMEEGQKQMLEKWEKGLFPRCPRSLCHGGTCLPCGICDELGKNKMKLFCPNCTDIYNYDSICSDFIDGAHFGMKWIHFLIDKYPILTPENPPEKFVPQVYGFQVYLPESSPQ